jgi:hypothetical protein
MVVILLLLVIFVAADGTLPPTTGAFFYAALETSAGYEPPLLYMPLQLGATTTQIASGPKYNITDIDKTGLNKDELKNGYLQTVTT